MLLLLTMLVGLSSAEHAIECQLVIGGLARPRIRFRAVPDQVKTIVFSRRDDYPRQRACACRSSSPQAPRRKAGVLVRIVKTPNMSALSMHGAPFRVIDRDQLEPPKTNTLITLPADHSSPAHHGRLAFELAVGDRDC